MDRSFLSQPSVVEASRDFVCIRLATYEDKAEADWLQNIFVGRSGELENTVFALMAPDGKTLLSRPGRGPNFAFSNAPDMASRMTAIAKQYPEQPRGKDQPVRLPQMKDFRLSLNVAACDGLPLVVAYGQGEQLANYRNLLTGLAFDKQLAGKFHFFATGEKSDLEAFKEFSDTPGLFLIRPGKYGTDGSIVDLLESESALAQSKDLLAGYSLLLSKVEKSHREHVRDGIRDGVDWQTEIRVTDPESVRAREQLRGRGAK